jgi:hypothetical protein
MSATSQLQPGTLIIGAISVTVGLAWSNAITAIIDYYVPAQYADSKNMWVKLMYAVVLTILAVMIAKLVDKYSKK